MRGAPTVRFWGSVPASRELDVSKFSGITVTDLYDQQPSPGIIAALVAQAVIGFVYFHGVQVHFWTEPAALVSCESTLMRHCLILTTWTIGLRELLR